jgi:MFS family permease
VTARRPRSWFAVVLAVVFLQQVAVFAIRPMISYRALDVGAGVAGVGLVAASFAVGALVFAIPAGRWVDVHGEARFIVAGALVISVSSLALTLAANLATLVVLHAVLGLGHLFNMVGLQTLVAHSTARDVRFGRFTVAASLGQLVGPALAGLVAGGADAAATGRAFVLGAAVALVATLAALPLWLHSRAEPSGRVDADRASGIRSTAAAVLRVPSMKQAMLASLTVLTSVDLLVAYLPAYGEAAGLSVQTVGMLLAVRAALSIASRLLMGRLTARFTRHALLAASMALPALGFVAMPFTSRVDLLVAIMVVLGFWLGIGQPLTMAWVADRAPATARGTAMAVRLSGNRLGQVMLPLAAGAAAGVGGVAGVFWGIAALLLAVSAVIVRAPFGEPPVGTSLDAGPD